MTLPRKGTMGARKHRPIKSIATVQHQSVSNDNHHRYILPLIERSDSNVGTNHNNVRPVLHDITNTKHTATDQHTLASMFEKRVVGNDNNNTVQPPPQINSPTIPLKRQKLVLRDSSMNDGTDNPLDHSHELQQYNITKTSSSPSTGATHHNNELFTESQLTSYSQPDLGQPKQLLSMFDTQSQVYSSNGESQLQCNESMSPASQTCIINQNNNNQLIDESSCGYTLGFNHIGTSSNDSSAIQSRTNSNTDQSHHRIIYSHSALDSEATQLLDTHCSEPLTDNTNTQPSIQRSNSTLIHTDSMPAPIRHVPSLKSKHNKRILKSSQLSQNNTLTGYFTKPHTIQQSSSYNRQPIFSSQDSIQPTQIQNTYTPSCRAQSSSAELHDTTSVPYNQIIRSQSLIQQQSECSQSEFMCTPADQIGIPPTPNRFNHQLKDSRIDKTTKHTSNVGLFNAVTNNKSDIYVSDNNNLSCSFDSMNTLKQHLPHTANHHHTNEPIIYNTNEYNPFITVHGRDETPAECRVSISSNRLHTDWIILEHIGKGSFGVISMVRNRRDHCIYAMKHIRRPIKSSTTKHQYVYRELYALSALNTNSYCPINILKYYTAWIEHDSDSKGKSLNQLYIITEYCSNGDISRRIRNNKSNPDNSKHTRFTINELLLLCKQICTALHYMHHHMNMAHLDIKPANILESDAGVYKLSDYGLCSIISDDLLDYDEGDKLYLPDEVLSRDTCNDRIQLDKVDMYSLGMTLYELAANTLLSDTPDLTISCVKDGDLSSLSVCDDTLNESHTNVLYDIIRHCVHRDPNYRYTAQQCINLIDNELTELNKLRVIQYEYERDKSEYESTYNENQLLKNQLEQYQRQLQQLHSQLQNRR